MNKRTLVSLVLAAFLGGSALAQVTTISIAAGSPEDKALQEIAKESEAPKRLEKYELFLKDSTADPAAVAYAYSQMAQIANDSGNLDQALAYGDKALAALPGCMDLLVAQIAAAQQKKDTAKVVAYAAMAAKAYDGIDTAVKPAEMSDAVFEERKSHDKAGAKSSYQYAESVAFNAAANESDPTRRVAALESFVTAFPKGQFASQAAELVLAGYQQLKQPGKFVEFGEKLLAQNPDSVPTLILLADHYAEAPGTVTKSLDYARKALKLAGSGGAEGENAVLTASAKSIIGYAYLRQEKYAAALPELEAAAPVLKSDPNAYSAVLYRLGFTYAKLKRYPEAKKSLGELVAQGGPYKPLAEDLLKKIAVAARRR